MKGYKVKSSAARTAKKEFGADYKDKGSLVEDAEGMWCFELNSVKVVEPVVEIIADEEQEPELLESWGDGMQPAAEMLAIIPGDPGKTELVLAEVEKPTEAPTVEQCDKVLAHVTSKTEQVFQLKASWRDNPCKAVWDIAESMPGAKRKDILAACVEAGIAYNTARTQYQRFFTASKG